MEVFEARVLHKCLILIHSSIFFFSCFYFFIFCVFGFLTWGEFLGSSVLDVAVDSTRGRSVADGP